MMTAAFMSGGGCYSSGEVERPMKKRSDGLLLLLTFVVAAASLIQDYRLSATIAGEREASLEVEREFGAMDSAVAGYRGAQAAYVADAGSLPAWTARTDALSTELEATLGRLRVSGAPGAASQYDAATAALADLAARDARARALVRSGSQVEASDIIFAESADPLQRLSAALSEARTLERAAIAERLTFTERLRMGVVAGAVVFLLAVSVFFRRRRKAAASAPAADVEMGNRLITPMPAAQTTAATPRGAPSASGSALNLADAAEVCADLARVIDGRDVPVLLERALGVLGARGAILWVADTAGAVLRPSFTSGYSEKVLEKMGVLQTNADNATSLAFRSMRTQVVRAASPSTRGAIAVPLVTAAGCVGVLSAEVDPSHPSQDTLSIARIIAAQIAAIVGPSDGAATHAAQA